MFNNLFYDFGAITKYEPEYTAMVIMYPKEIKTS
jgi:hypothetical protein